MNEKLETQIFYEMSCVVCGEQCFSVFIARLDTGIFGIGWDCVICGTPAVVVPIDDPDILKGLIMYDSKHNIGN